MGKAKEAYMYIMGALVVMGVFALTGLIIFKEIPVGSKDAVMLSLGALLGLGVAVVQYFYGSSKGSADKTTIINETAKETAATVQKNIEETK